jgi:hypothetical protein
LGSRKWSSQDDEETLIIDYVSIVFTAKTKTKEAEAAPRFLKTVECFVADKTERIARPHAFGQ